MIRHLLKKTSFIALLPALTLSLNVNAARNYENTWFEIEVILFSQIGDKSRLQEVFPESSTLPQPLLTLDLLGPYLGSDISSLKNKLPNCEGFLNDAPSPFLNETFASKNSLLEIHTDYKEDKLALPIESIFNETVKFPEEIQKTDPSSLVDSAYSNFNEINDKDSDENIVFDTALIQAIKNSYQHNQPLMQVNIPNKLCKIPSEFFNEYKKENPEFYYNGPEQSQMPILISGEEDLTTEASYLINEESLKLQDIFEQLKRSRNFKPLMHMGWRQKTKGPREAIPLKLYAGENLIQPYNKALSAFNRAKQNALAIEQNNLLITEQQTTVDINGNVLFDSELATQEVTQQNELHQQVTNILAKEKSTEPEISSLLAELTSDPSDIITPVINVLDTGEESNIEQQLIKPEKPLQNWTIEGFLKVEVEHFLHITADFNVINMSLAEQATKQVVSKQPVTLKSIRFEQNKRVRSKEIHYFDHPYMGMIVQIRRHEQVAPAEEADAE